MSARLLPHRTLLLIRSRAAERRYLSFGEIARDQDVPWPQVRRGIGDHLKSVCGLALGEGGPLVSSIVVNRKYIGTGAMEPETRAGFLVAARDLGFAWTDGEAFLREQQEATFAWAARSNS